MIFFWGWKVRFSTVGETEFHCPHCRADRHGERQAARRWFTFFFLALIPLKTLGEFIRCGTCHNRYDIGVLEIPTSATTSDQLAAAQREAAVGLIRIDDNPKARAAAIARISEVGSAPWTESFVDSDVRSLDVTGLPERLRALTGVLNEHGKEQFLGSAASVAAASGHITEPSRQAIFDLARALGMTDTHAGAVIDVALQRASQPSAPPPPPV